MAAGFIVLKFLFSTPKIYLFHTMQDHLEWLNVFMFFYLDANARGSKKSMVAFQ